MNLKDAGNKILFSIPHFSEIFNVRRNQRYTPPSDLNVEIKDTQGAHIDGKLFDISFDGMRLITSDKRIENLKTISLLVNNFRVELPCKKIWQDEYYYRVEFGSMDRQEFAKCEYFIEHFIKTAPDNLLELFM